MKKTTIFFTGIAMLLLSSCASIVSKSVYNVPFTSQPSGADLKITNLVKNEVVYEGTTPASIELKSGAGFFKRAKYEAEFQLDGEIIVFPLNATFDGWYVGNFVFGGVIGLLIVDPASGAMYRLDTSSVDADFTKELISPSASRLDIHRLEDIPCDWRNHLVELN